VESPYKRKKKEKKKEEANVVGCKDLGTRGGARIKNGLEEGVATARKDRFWKYCRGKIAFKKTEEGGERDDLA